MKKFIQSIDVIFRLLAVVVCLPLFVVMLYEMRKRI